ncbi:putative histone deacetylase HOS2 [Fulvia fulva]|uniref:Histone deacetylase n=1 Tax=Passalora fulva TaxID=5499 RepID=A0A9Q8LGW1_PASFU|nr:putative histone deacetylase HOS2 [Fulvia fulva]KAK4626155.1 putative histone deacetylase HOS2 [Fulvia fulva]KAK4627591.1 putative histone deacetylase HOS2 [Fulvia fulva]UJO17155.1 putative histone deacetylase HOS2 [Fulvia fulva]WPV14005.1 putative histone deacetylase HOS2 [Fulvia fulva]WPV29261.1 putative histone deacetylase HOS2 [Fulvia fulva]
MSGASIPRADARNGIVQQWDAHVNGRNANHTPPSNGSASPTRAQHSCGMEDSRLTPPVTEEDEKLWRDQELNAKIMRQVEEQGITRPKGHKVSYHYNSGVENMHFGRTHPMKPWRLTLTKHLVLGHGLQYSMDTYEPVAAGLDQVRKFHDKNYVEFLSKVSPDTFNDLCKIPKFAIAIPPKHEGDTVELGPFNLSTSPGADCPVFDGMSTYLFLYTGATLHATHQLTSNQSDIAINWSGGLHHAHKYEASGFCYINDIVLSIIDMLRVYARVLYIDIDVHHGDGVEEAFQRHPRVMTLSYHRYGPYDDTGHKFFPGTGDLDDVGLKGTAGEHFALNVPIPSGIDDRQYKFLYEEVTGRAIDAFKPSAVVLQCGADSLGGDRLGQFNINIKQHGECVSFVKKRGLPLLLLGGGGYTARNVARAWCHETALATDNELPDKIPMDIVPQPLAFQNKAHGSGMMYPSFERLHKNECKDSDLEYMVKKLDDDLRYVRNAPWVKMDQLPTQGAMKRIMDEADEDLHATKHERDRRWKERNPAGRGELR